MDFLIVQIVSEEQTESKTLRDKMGESVAQEDVEVSEKNNGWNKDAEDDVVVVCEMVRAVDFTVEEPHMELTEEEDQVYKRLMNQLRSED